MALTGSRIQTPSARLRLTYWRPETHPAFFFPLRVTKQNLTVEDPDLATLTLEDSSRWRALHNRQPSNSLNPAFCPVNS